MEKYNDSTNYCGPQWLLLIFSAILPQKVFFTLSEWLRTLPGSVDINYESFLHDRDYEIEERRKTRDIIYFQRVMKKINKKIPVENKDYLPAVSRIYAYYLIIRAFGWISVSLSHFKR